LNPNPSKSSKISKELDFSLIFNKNFSEILPYSSLNQGQMKWAKKYSAYDVTHNKSKTQKGQIIIIQQEIAIV